MIILHIQCIRKWVKSSVDIGNAFINAFVKKIIMMEMPKDLIGKTKVVVRLLRNLYGMKDAGLLWYELICKFLFEELAYIKGIHDPCVFIL